MVAAPALGDVMQQDRQVKRRQGLHLVDHRAREGKVILEPFFLDSIEDADGADGVLVDGIDVVHVVLHLGDDAAEIGQEASQDPGFVEPHEGHFRIGAGKDFHELTVGVRVLAQFPVDQFQVLAHQAKGIGMNIDLVALGEAKQLQHFHRRFFEGVLVLDAQTVAVEDEILDLAPPKAEARKAEPGVAFFLLFLQDGAENPGQVADVLGDQKVMLPEPLDPLGAGLQPGPGLYGELMEGLARSLKGCLGF